MSVNIAAVSPPDDKPSAVIRNRVVCFVNDDLSAAALRTGLEGSNFSRSSAARSVTPYRCSKPTPSYSRWWRTSAGSMIRSRNWKGWPASARPTSGWR